MSGPVDRFLDIVNRIAGTVEAFTAPPADNMLPDIEEGFEVWGPMGEIPELPARPVQCASGQAGDVEGGHSVPGRPGPSGYGPADTYGTREQPLTDLELVAVRELLLQHFPALASKFADERIARSLKDFRDRG